MVKTSRPYQWGRRKTDQLLKIDFIRFGIVGSIGFLVSICLLYVYDDIAGLPLFLAFLLSNEGGLLSNFAFHENWTYKHLDHKGKSLPKKLLNFHLSSWSGIAIIVVTGMLCVKVLGFNKYTGQAVGSGIAMFWNFFWTRYFIFKGKTPAVLQHPEETVPEVEA